MSRCINKFIYIIVFKNKTGFTKAYFLVAALTLIQAFQIADFIDDNQTGDITCRILMDAQ